MTALEDVIRRIDEANAADPTLERDGNEEVPAALLYGRRMSGALLGFVSDPSELLQIAARGQHIERWLLPRQDYPQGRVGYLAWRRDQGRRHAERLSAIMDEAGYSEADRARVGRLLRKEGIKRDPEVQTLEDVICLVFLRHYALDFASGHEPDDVERILKKTARKMSAEGRTAALRLDIPAPIAAMFA